MHWGGKQKSEKGVVPRNPTSYVSFWEKLGGGLRVILASETPETEGSRERADMTKKGEKRSEMGLGK